MKKLFILAIVLAPAIIAFSCKHDPILPETEVSFSNDIQPILQMGCSHAGCHGDSLNPVFKLVTYEQVMDKGEVKAGDPHDSELYQVLVTEDSEDKMPRAPYPELNDRNKKLIFIWIAQGAKNN
jgi:hypothetical protein